MRIFAEWLLDMYHSVVHESPCTVRRVFLLFIHDLPLTQALHAKIYMLIDLIHALRYADKTHSTQSYTQTHSRHTYSQHIRPPIHTHVCWLAAALPRQLCSETSTSDMLIDLTIDYIHSVALKTQSGKVLVLTRYVDIIVNTQNPWHLDIVPSLTYLKLPKRR